MAERSHRLVDGDRISTTRDGGPMILVGLTCRLPENDHQIGQDDVEVDRWGRVEHLADAALLDLPSLVPASHLLGSGF